MMTITRFVRNEYSNKRALAEIRQRLGKDASWVIAPSRPFMESLIDICDKAGMTYESAMCVAQTQEETMEWSKNAPVKSGWYEYDLFGDSALVFVDGGRVYHDKDGQGDPVSCYAAAKWRGPVPAPGGKSNA